MKVLAVDDNPINLSLLELTLQEQDVDFFGFEDPKAALKCLDHEGDWDVLLVDYMMPEMNGIEFIKAFQPKNPNAIIMMITAATTVKELKIQALEAGATDFLAKPLDIVEFKNRLNNLYQLRKVQKTLHMINENLKADILQTASTVEQRELETLTVLSSLAEYKDPETASHINRVAHYSKILAEKIGLSKEEIQVLFYASPLHDMGKVGIPDEILLKPGKLTEAEFETMKTHAEIGYQILKNAQNSFLKAGAIICLSHHEKYDGTGYPNGLMGENIPLYGRITAIADVFDALTSERPYKKAWSFEEAFQFISEQKGKHFDPKLAEVFTQAHDEVRAVFDRFEEPTEFVSEVRL